MGGVQGPQDASFPFMDFSMQRLVGIIKADPAVAHVNAYTGGRGSSNGGFVYMALKPLGKQCKESDAGCDVRQTAAMDVINRLRPKINRLPIASAFMQPAQDLRIGGRGGNALYQYTIQTESVADLAHWGPILMANMRKLPGLQDVNSDQQNGGLREMLTFDRATRGTPGPDRAVARPFALQRLRAVAGFGHLFATEPVLRRAGSGAAVLAGSIGTEQIFLATGTAAGRSGTNAMSPLLTLMKPKTGTTPLQVNHTGLFPSVTVSFNLANGYALSDATREIIEMETKPWHSCHGPRLLCRNRAGLRGIAGVREIPRYYRAACGLHRARHSVREHGASADHHLHAAIGQRRRDAGADVVQHGI